MDTEALDKTDEQDTQADDQADTDEQQADNDGGEETVILIGDESPEDEELDKAPQWVRDLRTRNRELERENRSLKTGAKEEVKPLPDKPTLAGCDYDNEEFERQVGEWYELKREHDDAETARKKQAEDAEAKWNGKLKRYTDLQADLPVKDFKDAEAVVLDTLSVTQQGIIIQGAENPALVAYALGKNPKKAAELAKITDPIEFAGKVFRMEANLKMQTRKKPDPEGMAPDNVSTGSESGDKQLEKLREEAARTGDYTKVTAYKRNRKQN